MTTSSNPGNPDQTWEDMRISEWREETTQRMRLITASTFSRSASEFVDVCLLIAEMLVKKNKAYGDSAMSPVRIFSTAPADEQIRVRLDDKLSRLARGNAAGEDVLLDLAGYLVILLALQERARNEVQADTSE